MERSERYRVVPVSTTGTKAATCSSSLEVVGARSLAGRCNGARPAAVFFLRGEPRCGQTRPVREDRPVLAADRRRTLGVRLEVSLSKRRFENRNLYEYKGYLHARNERARGPCPTRPNGSAKRWRFSRFMNEGYDNGFRELCRATTPTLFA